MDLLSTPRRTRLATALALAALLTVTLGSGRAAHADPAADVAAPPAADTAADPLTLEAAWRAAQSASPLLAAARAQTAASRELVVAADRRPDPMLKLGLINLPVDGPDRFSLGRDFMTMRSVGVAQEFVRAEKRQARRERAEGEVDAARIAERQSRSELRRDIAAAWFERSYQESMRELQRAQVESLELEAVAAESAWRGGKGSQADVHAARGQVEQLRDALDQTDRAVAVATSRLARWLGGEAQRPLAPRPPLTLPAWATDRAAMALDHHPMIASLTQRERLAEADAHLAQAEKTPDWTAEVSYSQRGSAYSNMLSINLSVPVQWDQSARQDRELAARQTQVAQARALREDAQRAHEAEVRALLLDWDSLQTRLARYDATRLPLATQRSEAALAAYRGNGGPLSAVLQARHDELVLRAERLAVDREAALLWAQLDALDPPDGDRDAAQSLEMPR